ncbi:MAG TPA: DEAD/DEAH box helicase family protein [Solirubrobacteraceae bacterium]|nr:DEAD/DEAH box helicase family protein [Solirubrobacteraceae bacterium]
MPIAVPPTTRTSLRGWQERALVAMRAWRRGPFLVSAAPGSGKTRPALVFARELLRAGVVKRVVVVCPTTPLTDQWAAAAGRLGVHLVPDAAELRPPRDFDGVAVTYARVATVAERWARQCGAATLVIADEAHHLGEDLTWGQGFHVAFRDAARWLLLSGTPFRSDQSPIPGVRYDDGVAVPDVSYTYADAVRDAICRPVTFVPYDGVLQWREGDDEVVEASFRDALAGREAGRRYRTAISVELQDGLPRILAAAHARLEDVRAGGHRDAGGLVVAADGEHARAIAQILREVCGQAPTVVLHTEARAAEKLRRFTASRERWIVAVNMVSEGVDIPRLRVGVYATAAKTPLIFRQIVGRFVRTIPGRPLDMSWLYLPADPVLRRHAADVETELRHVLRPPSDDPGAAGLDERPERRETERTGAEAFVPVAADVAPQLALFGPPGGAPAVTPVLAAGAAPAAEPAPDEAAEPEMPAFERRALLRDKRHRLVADLRRRDGRSHAEINNWLNRASGIRRVNEATIEQLERSIELLLVELSRRAPRRRTA